LIENEQTKDSELHGSKHFPNLICSLIPSQIKFEYVIAVPKYFNFSTLSKDLVAILQAYQVQ
jgi:hypothetical protein